MKSYDELKAEMETIQQQMAEAKKNERANALKEVKRLCKEFGFTAGMLKGSLAEGRKKTMKISKFIEIIKYKKLKAFRIISNRFARKIHIALYLSLVWNFL